MASPLLWLVLLCTSLAFATSAAGLHLKLTHIDAKENCTVQERMRRATERTHRRLASTGDVAAPVQWAGMQYIAEYLIGEPPQQAQAIIDTGSDLIWTQCSACQSSSCFPQNLSYYDPTLSRTAQAVACSDNVCHLGSETQCASDGKTCAVVTSYGAGDIAGVLGTETFTFQSEEVSLAFGCITATNITNGSLYGASGIIGLGRGQLSLVNQLGDTMFSYCLTPYSSDATDTSHLFVGASASLSSNAPVTSVPFVPSPEGDPYNMFYYLPLAGITVGETVLDVPAAAFELRQVEGDWAGTLIDSGSSFTSLVDVAYQALRSELTQQLGATSFVAPPSGMEEFDLCVAQEDASSLVPKLVLNFGNGGGDLVVPPENYWGLNNNPACMMVVSSAEPGGTLAANETTTIGNYMTQNMNLLYDLGNGMLSFQTVDCSSM